MLSKRVFGNYSEKRAKALENTIAECADGVDVCINVYRKHRTSDDIGGMIGDLARIVAYKWQAGLARQEIELLAGWPEHKAKADQVRDLRENGRTGVESQAIAKLSAEYWKRCPRGDKLPHEVLGIDLK